MWCCTGGARNKSVGACLPSFIFMSLARASSIWPCVPDGQLLESLNHWLTNVIGGLLGVARGQSAAEQDCMG